MNHAWHWLRSMFAWREVRDTGVWLYEENAVTGARRALQIGGGYQPLDHHWLERTVDTRPIGPMPPSRHD